MRRNLGYICTVFGLLFHFVVVFSEDFRVTTSTSEIEAHLTTSCDTSQYQSEAETISETDETRFVGFSFTVSQTIYL